MLEDKSIIQVVLMYHYVWNNSNFDYAVLFI